MTALKTITSKDLSSATKQARAALANIDNPRIRELLTNGLLFSAQGASAQSVIQVYAPILAELGVDFALQHMHDSEDEGARDLAHKFLRDVVSHGVKIGIVETVLDATAEENEKAILALGNLLQVKEMLSKEGMQFEKAVEKFGVVVEAEVEE
jgi:hypothetical protein